MNAHFELAAELLDAGADPNADLHRLHRASRDHRRSASPASATTIRRPKDPATMTSLELVKKLVGARRQRQRADDEEGESGQHAVNEIGATPFFLAALTADAELMRALARSAPIRR